MENNMFWHGFYGAVIAMAVLFTMMTVAESEKTKIKVKKCFNIITKAWCAGIFTIIAAEFTLIYSIVLIVLPVDFVFSALISSVLLVISWYIEEKIYQVLTGEGLESENKVLTKEEKNVCNVLALCGVIVSGILSSLEQGNKEYIILISISISIWIGAYVPISKVFEGKSVKAILEEVRKEFCPSSKLVWSVASIAALIVAFSALKNPHAQTVFSNMDKLGLGIIVGLCTVPGVVCLWRLVKQKKELHGKKEN